MGYITMSEFASSGGLCSQLQIYASLLAVAKANNLEVVFSNEMIENHANSSIPDVIKVEVFNLLDLKCNLKPHNFFKNFEHKHINFHTTKRDESLFNLDSSKNYDLKGRFDLYTYWYNDIKKEVESWKYKENLQIQATERIEKVKSKLGDKPTVSIHLRRGDYLLPKYSNAFCRLDNNYYLKAIKDNFQPIKDYNFIIFSNDIEYCKKIFTGDNIWYVEPKINPSDNVEKVWTDSEKEDLALMSLCDHHIIANSSYSWWGAFLCKNKNKKIICPTNYLKSTHTSSWINGNWYPPNWININN